MHPNARRLLSRHYRLADDVDPGPRADVEDPSNDVEPVDAGVEQGTDNDDANDDEHLEFE